MTVAELFMLAKEKGVENSQIFIGYSCDDDCYGIDCERVLFSNIEVNAEAGVYGGDLPSQNILIII